MKSTNKLRIYCLFILFFCQLYINWTITPSSAVDEVLNPTTQAAPIHDTKIGTVIKNKSKVPFEIAGSFSRNLQQYTGITPTSEFLIDQILQRLLRKIFGGKIKVRVKTYSFTDLIHLKVKSAKLSFKSCHYKDIPLGIVQIESKTPVWFILKKGEKLDVKYPALFSFKMEVTEGELDQMLHSERVTNSLRALRLDLSSLGPGLGEQRLQMHEPIVTLEDDSIVVKSSFSTQDAEPSTASFITISGRPQLYGDDRIFLENVYVDSPDITEPEKFSNFVEHLINPLVNLCRFDKKYFAMRLDEFSIKDKKVTIRGRVIVAPRAQNKNT